MTGSIHLVSENTGVDPQTLAVIHTCRQQDRLDLEDNRLDNRWVDRQRRIDVLV